MRYVESRIRFGSGFGPATFFATLVAVLAAALLLVFPARALAAPAELSITKEGQTRVEPGTLFDYVLTVSNKEGVDAATDVVVKDELPLGATLDDYESPAGVSCTPPPATTVTCTGLSLEAGESKTITLTVKAPRRRA